MPGSATAIRQERLKKTNARPIPLGLFTINEEDEQPKNGNSRRLKAPDGCKVQDKKTASNRPSATISGQNSSHSGNKPDPPPVLRVDDRQRLARERREERDKQLAAREIVWLEREERARLHYEKHLEEQRRRAAVEEKRRQRLEEDKERLEAVVRRTMERSQKPRQKYNRWSWGGPLHGSPSIHSSDPDRRSVSTMNLSKHVDPVISKRLSSSSATLLNSPDRARRLQLSPWESNVVNRLLMPTHSFLARSKSTAALSGDAASCSPIIMPYKAAHSRNPVDRPKLFVTPPEGSARRRTVHGATGHKRDRENVPFHLTSGVRRTLSPANPKGRSPAPSRLWLPSKSFPHLPGTPRPASSLPPGSVKAAPAQAWPPSPGNIRPGKKEARVEPEKKDPEKELQSVASEPSLRGRAPLVKVAEAEAEEATPVEPEADTVGFLLVPICTAAPAQALDPAPAPAPAAPPASVTTTPPPVTASAASKVSAGTTDPEEATRLLAEKRKLAREQREKEERERREKEELERQKKEELAQRVAEERARREEEARRLEAEQAQEKEEQLRLERERAETERAQKQKEEEARVREEAERARQERERHFQREEQERLERKKRLEEIMKRTRRTEAAEKKTVDQRNGDIAKGALAGATEAAALPCMTDSPGSGDPGTSPHVVTSHQPKVTMESFPSAPNLEKQPNENGVSVENETFEESITLPIGSKPSRLDVINSDSPEIPLTPILAFDEEGMHGPLPQVDGVKTQQTA
ncbi:Ensconsin, partial [Heterocephalus glaber]